jgi:drug/metabolite transporter (DMT)-like permease
MAFPANALIALASAASWGGGDFSGGMGVKAAAQDAGDATRGALRLVIVAHGVSLVALVALLLVLHAPRPAGAPMIWGIAAGAAAAVSLTAFYMALARGQMGVSAAISGLIAAAIPAVLSAFTEGSPRALTLAGFLLAGAAIWLVAAGPSPENAEDTAVKGTLALALVGGFGFGFYFVALKFANPLGLFEPMALARAASLVCCTLLLLGLGLYHRAKGKSAAGPLGASWLSRRALLCALGVAVLDTGGNILFIAATRLGRLDVASVLASLYPASTILLAAWQLHERPTRRQVTGMLLALVAVVMITV